MFHMSRITLDLPDELLEAVDSTRGLVPRNAWIRDVLTQHLNRPRVPEPKPSKAPPPREEIHWSPPSTPPPEEYQIVMLDHAWVGTGSTCKRLRCPDPKNRVVHL